MEIEHFFICPYCWQNISMVLDLSADNQEYIEDCEVCCRPITISFKVDDGVLSGFIAESIEQ
ncbi:MAG: CPXCG motif-containing cysteine-rich protein [Pyrinomonadaceae bacterium]|nr:CPXCG motif-containing cysteine-rich protein [Pyrinomonadaceae bacterium]